MKPDKKTCLCPYCGQTYLKSKCDQCSHRDFMFEDVCFCPHSEAYFLQEEPLVDKTSTSEGVTFPQWQGQDKRLHQ